MARYSHLRNAAPGNNAKCGSCRRAEVALGRRMGCCWCARTCSRGRLLLQVRALGADGGVVAMARHHDRLRAASGENSRSSIDWMMVVKSPPGNLVAPGPPGKKGVAGEQHRRAQPWGEMNIDPGGMTGRGDGVQAEGGRSRSPTGRRGAKSYEGNILGIGLRHAHLVTRRKRTAGTAWMWSQWPWVSMTLRTPRRWHNSGVFSCSLAASMRKGVHGLFAAEHEDVVVDRPYDQLVDLGRGCPRNAST